MLSFCVLLVLVLLCWFLSTFHALLMLVGVPLLMLVDTLLLCFVGARGTPLPHSIGVHHCPFCCVLSVLVSTSLLFFIGVHHHLFLCFVVACWHIFIVFNWWSLAPPCYCWCSSAFLTFVACQHSFVVFYCCSLVLFYRVVLMFFRIPNWYFSFAFSLQVCRFGNCNFFHSTHLSTFFYKVFFFLGGVCFWTIFFLFSIFLLHS